MSVFPLAVCYCGVCILRISEASGNPARDGQQQIVPAGICGEQSWVRGLTVDFMQALKKNDQL